MNDTCWRQFFRNWADYKSGFGSASGEYWLGNDHIHAMTSQTAQKLWIYLHTYDSDTYNAYYNTFSVAAESSGYELTAGSYTGNAGDGLNKDHASFRSSGMQFTTHDDDNDKSTASNCATSYHGAWWYNACFFSHLNGRYWQSSGCPYPSGSTKTFKECVRWSPLSTKEYDTVYMKIKPK